MIGKKHWDAQVIVIDMHPPNNNNSSHSKHTKNYSQLMRDRHLTRDRQLTNKRQLTKKSQLTNKSQLTKSKHSRRFTSLGVLLNLDLTFMRPKLIFVRLLISSSSSSSSSIDKSHHMGSHHERGKSS